MPETSDLKHCYPLNAPSSTSEKMSDTPVHAQQGSHGNGLNARDIHGKLQTAQAWQGTVTWVKPHTA
eukprot:1160316-Pelagomonas_calceolata.AAC.12